MLTKEEARKSCNWYVLDATGKTLGRFASEIVKILCGKHRADYTPHAGCCDGVIVVNAGGIVVSGSKEARKKYFYYTGHIGGLRERSYRDVLNSKPEYIITHAVKGMLPQSVRQQMTRLRVFRDDKHGMQAQKPITVNI